MDKIKGEGCEKFKIFPLHEVFYIECVISAAESAIRSWEELNKIISNSELLVGNGLKTIDLSENIINQAGIISKYFYPPSNKGIHKFRSEKLRESYDIDNFNLLEERGFRNHIEHFDERLDKFLKDCGAGVIIPKRLFKTSEEIDSIINVFKAYVINDFKLISLSQEIELKPLVEEIYRVYNLSIDFIENRGRLPR
ncbi:hypothetical protein FNW52_11625 [Flavobacterium sp. ZT3R18]|uniref:hypothetical protein n=1 Tax=Flavobacterium sp. ZT3R18 TaxID=2594429 RepID=UPI00117BC65E|nr:hypothetical protein [Flavobacterium sp. ZT3R18]TRX35363.1 hypothetical protein FNW52_11625 [Flavobacterium sp. ZT3R18]